MIKHAPASVPLLLKCPAPGCTLWRPVEAAFTDGRLTQWEQTPRMVVDFLEHLAEERRCWSVVALTLSAEHRKVAALVCQDLQDTADLVYAWLRRERACRKGAFPRL